MDLTCSFQMINQSAFIKHRVQKFDALQISTQPQYSATVSGEEIAGSVNINLLICAIEVTPTRQTFKQLPVQF